MFPKSSHNRFYLKQILFHTAKNVKKYLEYFLSKFVVNNLKKWPYLVTLVMR